MEPVSRSYTDAYTNIKYTHLDLQKIQCIIKLKESGMYDYYDQIQGRTLLPIMRS